MILLQNRVIPRLALVVVLVAAAQVGLLRVSALQVPDWPGKVCRQGNDLTHLARVLGARGVREAGTCSTCSLCAQPSGRRTSRSLAWEVQTWAGGPFCQFFTLAFSGQVPNPVLVALEEKHSALVVVVVLADCSQMVARSQLFSASSPLPPFCHWC